MLFLVLVLFLFKKNNLLFILMASQFSASNFPRLDGSLALIEASIFWRRQSSCALLPSSGNSAEQLKVDSTTTCACVISKQGQILERFYRTATRALCALTQSLTQNLRHFIDVLLTSTTSILIHLYKVIIKVYVYANGCSLISVSAR